MPPPVVAIDRLRVPPGGPAALADRPTRADLGLPGKKAGRRLLRRLNGEIADLQARLWAEDRRAVLLVLQGMDTSGKDGTIRRVLTGVNPQGVRVEAFKQPSANERDRDYLWRVHAAVPRRGEIGVFNRSHYEDVGVVRVLDLVPEDQWRRRYEHILAFEQLLHDEGTVVRKVWLHVSREEQAERLRARLDDPVKRWKFSRGDLAMRERWDDFQTAYEEAISRTSTSHAPWYVVPADRKWVRDVAVATILATTLRSMAPRPPEPEEDLDGIEIV